MRAGFCWAATILLAVALGVAYRGRDWITATATLARAAVGDHRNCALQFRLAEQPISLEEAAQCYGAAHRVLDLMTLARAVAEPLYRELAGA